MDILIILKINLVFVKKLTLVKYVISPQIIKEVKIECKKCGKHLNDEDNYIGKINYCQKCQNNLCDDCTLNHKKNHPNHNIRIIKRKFLKINDININDNDEYLNKCITCKKLISLRNNKKINYCENCKGNLCDVCKDLHYAQKPGHVLLYPKVILYQNKKYENDFICKICKKDLSKEISSPFDYCHNCQGNLCNRCAFRHINEFPTHKSELKIYLPDKECLIYYIYGYNCVYWKTN